MSEEKEDQPYNANDEKQVNRARSKAGREKILRTEFIRKMMSDRDGRAWINYILEFSSMFGNPHVRGDVYETHINIGMANLGKMIWADVEAASPEGAVLMLKEAKDDTKSK